MFSHWKMEVFINQTQERARRNITASRRTNFNVEMLVPSCSVLFAPHYGDVGFYHKR